MEVCSDDFGVEDLGAARDLGLKRFHKRISKSPELAYLMAMLYSLTRALVSRKEESRLVYLGKLLRRRLEMILGIWTPKVDIDIIKEFRRPLVFERGCEVVVRRASGTFETYVYELVCRGRGV